MVEPVIVVRMRYLYIILRSVARVSTENDQVYVQVVIETVKEVTHEYAVAV